MVGSGRERTWRAWGSDPGSQRNGQSVVHESVCKNEALDVVKTVTHKRGFESWRKLSKEYGATNGTSLHEYTSLLEYDLWKHGWIQEETVEVGKSDG